MFCPHTRRGARALRTAFAVTAIAGIFAATGCSGSSGSGGGDQPRMLLAVSSLSNPFFINMRDGAQEAADEAGVELSIVDAQDDAATQTNQLADAQGQGFDSIILNATDSDALTPIVGKVNDAEIPVVLVDRPVNDVESVTFVASDNVELGRLGGEALIEAIDGEGRVAVLRGISGLPSSNERFKGFNEAVEDAEGVEVVAEQSAEYDRAKGLDVMSNILQANPDIVGVFAENDEMALGAIRALGARAGEDVFVVGIDGTSDGIDAVEEGSMYATIAQQASELGKAAVEAAIEDLDGNDVDEVTSVPVKTIVAEE